MSHLQDKLEEYEKTDFYPFHMPGHKRNTAILKMGNPYGLDITEIDGFDNLHLADGILKGIMEEASAIYGAEQSYLLINGSTAGILIGMAACTRHGDTVIMARNCHRAVYHGVLINALKPVYIYPQEDEEWGISKGITAADVDNIIKKCPDAKMIILTSPTYEGMISEIEEIARVAHQYGIPLMVDEAHGAHFGWDSYFTDNSIKKGADIVIHSVHKTLPAFTQTALFHVKSGLVSKERIEQYFSVYQTSSPSYLLMAGIENCLCIAKERPELIKEWTEELTHFYRKAEQFQHIHVLQEEKNKKDASKLILSVKGTNMTGAELFNTLRDVYHLQMEAEYAHYVIAMTSMADTKEGFARLYQALKEIDGELWKKDKEVDEELWKKEKEVDGELWKIENEIEEVKIFPAMEQRITPYEAEGKEGVVIPLLKSIGYIAKSYIFLYPPGIPILAPGEVISCELVNLVLWYERIGLEVKGFKEVKDKSILVVGGKNNG